MATRKRQTKRAAPGRSYTVYFVPDSQTGGYTAHIPALGIVTEGETLRETRQMARDAIEGYLEAAKELGRRVPPDVTVAVELVEVSA